MSSFSPFATFADGDTMTAAQFMSEFTGLVPVGGFITDRPQLTTAADDDLILVYDTSSGTLSYITRSAFVATASTNSIKQTISQTSHGFGVGQALYESSTAGVYALASATSAALSDGLVGVIESVADINTFSMVTHGLLTAQSSLTAGTAYYLSDVTAGSMTSVAPSTAIRVYTAISTTAAIVNINRSAAASSNTTILPQFDCYLSLSSTNLVLNQANGSQIFINGSHRAISTTGVPLAPSTTASAAYWIYAYYTGSAIALELSSTTHVADGTYGHQIKSGDSTRSLVGWARTSSSTAWADSTTACGVASYYNRKNKPLTNALTATVSTASTTFTELSASLGRLELFSWGDEAVQIQSNGSISLNSATEFTRTSIGIDGVTAENTYSENQQPASSADYRMGYSVSAFRTLSEGFHYGTIIGLVSAATGSWYGSGTSGSRTTIRAIVRG